jgi:GTP-binding protein
VLLHLVDGTGADVPGAYRTVRRELEAYGGGLAEKPEIVALNKCDALDPDTLAGARAALAEATGADVACISGVAGTGIPGLLRGLLSVISESKLEAQAK